MKTYLAFLRWRIIAVTFFSWGTVAKAFAELYASPDRNRDEPSGNILWFGGSNHAGFDAKYARQLGGEYKLG